MTAPRGLTAYAFGYLIFLYLPVLLLPLFSFNDSSVVAFPLQGFTTRWYENLATIPALHEAFVNSLVVGLAASLIATILGIGASRAMTRYEFNGRGAIAAFLMVPMVLPEIIVAVALLVVLLQLGFELSLFTITLGHVLFCLPKPRPHGRRPPGAHDAPDRRRCRRRPYHRGLGRQRRLLRRHDLLLRPACRTRRAHHRLDA
jgi:ABC-type spermidine/putrescine transport system permease subunit II